MQEDYSFEFFDLLVGWIFDIRLFNVFVFSCSALGIK